MRKIITKIKEKVKAVIEILNRNEMRILPGQLAFYLLMSFIPIIVLVALITSRITENVDFIELVSSGIPASIAEMLKGIVNSVSSYDNFTFLTICYIFLAMNGPTSIIYVTNSLYELKQENYFKTKIKAFFMTIIIVLILLFLLIIPILGDLIIDVVFTLFFYTEFILDYIPIYKILVIVLTFLVVFIGIDLIYIIAPNKRGSIKTTYKGALFTTISWIIATEIFSFYVTNIAKYDQLYGNFANILVLLLWVYFLAYLFVFGIILNKQKYLTYEKVNLRSKKITEEKNENKKKC